MGEMSVENYLWGKGRNILKWCKFHLNVLTVIESAEDDVVVTTKLFALVLQEAHLVAIAAEK